MTQQETVEVTDEDINRAAFQWCGEKDRETSNDDILYFKSNWKALPGLRSRVETLAAHRIAAEKRQRERFQQGVDGWMDACFGEPIKSDHLERADRLTEEALELVQTVPGFTADRAHALVDYVFGRPVGERGQEVGGTIVCLAALCNTFGLSIADEADRELARIWTKVDAIRAKQAAKPTGSALPIAQEIRTQDQDLSLIHI